MAEDEDESQKTEQPTERRLEEAARKGQTIQSRELTTFLMLLVFTLCLTYLAPILSKQAITFLKLFIEDSHQIEISSTNLPKIYLFSIYEYSKLVIIPFVLVMIAAIVSNFVQNGSFIWTIEPLTPKLEKISLVKGFKRIFSMRSVVEFLKGILKIIIVLSIGYISVMPHINKLRMLYKESFAIILSYAHELARDMLIGICIVMAVVAGLDYMYQKYQFMKSLRMSKRDIKQELKETDGNPEIKAKLKQIRMQRAKVRMMAEVPKSDVIITNPTHYSIALKYDDLSMSAPVISAKGKDLVALKIREIANANDIPIVENPPLARALFASCELDDEIPLEHYKAVAEVISYVYKIKGKKPK